MNSNLTSHATPQNLEQQAQATQDAYIESCVRTIEIMVLEIRSIFENNPEVMKLSFDVDGDPDCFPLFTCLSESGEDLTEEFDDVNAIAERWNEASHPAVVAFLELMDGVSLSRETLVKDQINMCKSLAEYLPTTSIAKQEWLSSFGDYLSAWYQQSPKAPTSKPGPR